ncbi:MAG: FtsW/RodA/SpoVE family cell cycle protein [Ilumatobacteraceae bacterium]
MSTPGIAVRRRQAAERAAALRRHPSAGASRRDHLPPPTTFYVIALVVTVFTMLGLVMVLSASSIRLFHDGVSPWRTFNRQVVWAILGTVALWICARVPYQALRRFVVPGLGIATFLMLVPFLPGVGLEVNDASSWVSLGSLSLQPSEFMKLAVLLYCADLLTKRDAEMHDLTRTLKPTMLVAALAAGLCLLQGDLGSAIVLASIVFAVAFVRRHAARADGRRCRAGAAAAGVFVLSSQRRINRFTVLWTSPAIATT